MAGRCPWWAPPLLALQFLTRLPVTATNRLSVEAVRAGLARAVGWFPLVGALIGAITWNLITWWYGIPSSSSHALIGGIVGAVIATASFGAHWSARWRGRNPRRLLGSMALRALDRG